SPQWGYSHTSKAIFLSVPNERRGLLPHQFPFTPHCSQLIIYLPCQYLRREVELQVAQRVSVQVEKDHGDGRRLPRRQAGDLRRADDANAGRQLGPEELDVL